MKKIRVIIMTLLLALGAAVPLQANPQPMSEPAKVIMKAVDQVVDILKSGQYSGPGQQAALIQRLDPIMAGVFDFTELSRRTVGPRWSDFTPEQQEAFTKAFSRLLTDTYIGRLQAYSGEQVILTGERAGAKGNVEVQTEVVKDNRRTPIYYHVHQNPDWRIYDIWVEGVSLVKNYRTQFQQILVNKSPDELIQMINSKAFTEKK